MSRRACLCGLVAALASTCAVAHAQPKATETSYYYDLLDNSVIRPITRALDPALGIRKLTGNPKQALNIDADDQVRLPSTWWQPRLGFRDVSVEQMLAGPGSGTGPADASPAPSHPIAHARPKTKRLRDRKRDRDAMRPPPRGASYTLR